MSTISPPPPPGHSPSHRGARSDPQVFQNERDHAVRFENWKQAIISASSWAVLALTLFNFSLCTYLQILGSRLPGSVRAAPRGDLLHVFPLVTLALALAGVFISPLWFAGHLLLIVKKSDLLHSVIRSVLLHGRRYPVPRVTIHPSPPRPQPPLLFSIGRVIRQCGSWAASRTPILFLSVAFSVSDSSTHSSKSTSAMSTGAGSTAAASDQDQSKGRAPPSSF